MKGSVNTLTTALAGSYSQVFFSNNRLLALLLLLASFTDPMVGLAGLLAVVFAIAIGHLLGLSKTQLENGVYTYNVLLTGMAMGANFQMGLNFLTMLFFASVLCLMLSVWLASFAARYKLPFLSLPFVMSVWIIFLNARAFQTNLLLERNVHVCHNAYAAFVKDLSGSIEHAGLHRTVVLYLKSMASIFFQHNLLAGVVISIGLLLSSRIAFVLSWLGFIAGFTLYRVSFGEQAEQEFYFSGFNYIFAAIALAGFYLIPSIASFLLAVLSAPFIAMLSTALVKLTAPYYLPLYSLPFTLVVIIIISVLNNRYAPRFLDFTEYQLYSPEKNLYAFKTYLERFRRNTLFHIHLPFYGEWRVSQGHDGDKTHKEDWRHALDFVVCDEHGKTFKPPGQNVTDFYCYALPVLAPADGYVITVEDGIDDNAIGDVNLDNNWGNTVIIKHSEQLYSKLSHFKKDSIKVKTGDVVKRGDILGHCGNSGRSPEPHIHFQMQASPYIGAATLNYPLSYFFVKKDGAYTFHSFEVPTQGDNLLRPVATPLLKQAFHFIPGMKLNFEVQNGKTSETVSWEIRTDAFNQSYLHCLNTGSIAYFATNESVFYFTSFNGNTQSLLYYFYLAAYKVVLSFYPGLSFTDQLPVETSTRRWLLPLQDVVAPFYIFTHPVYQAELHAEGTGDSHEKIVLKSLVKEKHQLKDELNFVIELSAKKLNTITIRKNKTCITAKLIN